MEKATPQIDMWSGEFGKAYTDRNTLSLAEMDELYARNYGITRTEMNTLFVDFLDRSIRILEVGANTGNQLLCLQYMGFSVLYGVELQRYAVEMAKKRTQNIDIIAGSAFDVPFKDGFADLVMTSGVLIHISPTDIESALREIHRCSKKYIWGFEYYAETYTRVSYRGHGELLWKTDYARLYLDTFKDLRLVDEKRFKYRENDNVDTMFLLEKI